MTDQHEASLGIEFSAVEGLDRAMARANANLRPAPPSIRMAHWPNELGDSPQDAIGKALRLSWGGEVEETFRVDHIENDHLMLVRE